MRALALFALLLVSCSSGSGAPAAPTVRIDTGDGSVTFRVEVADDADERARGLMHRRSLADDAGMLFLFEGRSQRHFWMKDTLIPLDLISIRDGRVVAVQSLTPCTLGDDCPRTRTPLLDAALEVKAGTAERAGIEPGAPVESPLLP